MHRFSDMEQYRRMIEDSKKKLPLQRSIPSFRQFPLLSTIQQLHTHNLHIATLARKHSSHQLQLYQRHKQHYKQQVLPNYQKQLRNADSLEQSRKKSLHQKNRSRQKKNLDNIHKLEKAFGDKRKALADKEGRLMERSLVRRQEYLRSLHESFHKSQDKLYKFRQREDSQMRMSRTLFSSFELKVEAAKQRKEQGIQEMRALMSQKNSQVSLAQSLCGQADKKKEDQYIGRLIRKFEKSESNSAQKVQDIRSWLQEKRKEEDKLHAKNLKKRSLLAEMKNKARQEEHMKSEEKHQKAAQAKKQMLTTMTSSLVEKRKNKQNEIFNTTLSIMREREEKIEALNEKHRLSGELWQAYKEEKERLHSQNLAQSYVASHRE